MGLSCLANIFNGSSPRLRGTHGLVVLVRLADRFIPAPAGNTDRHYCLTLQSTVHPAPAGNTPYAGLGQGKKPVHPRACGEHAPPTIHTVPCSGSSPRLRGTRSEPFRDCRVRRFIPAPAGNTGADRSGCSGQSVHPRACGEHRMVQEVIRRMEGSSPRLRGTLYRNRSERTVRRFIPAPAGNTSSAFSAWTKSTVHPRACGNTPADSLGADDDTVHPRACGEHGPCSAIHKPTVGSSPRLRGHCAVDSIVIGLGGSSPRLRGTQRCRIHAGGNLRFIPAPAGNTLRSASPRLRYSVHPRACGEHQRPQYSLPECRGSSPRLRGTHSSSRRIMPVCRFIPAPAGNTV